MWVAIYNFFKGRKIFGTGNFVNVSGLIFPTEELIFDMHDYLIEIFANTKDDIHKGVRDTATLQHCLFTIKHRLTNKGRKKYRIIKRASYIFNYLANGHCFVDGNKRTAYVITMLFLIINNLDLHFDKTNYDSNYEFIMKISQRQTDDPENIIEIIEWLKKMTK